MPASRPEAAFILERARSYLDDELIPTLDGYHRFQCRVLANVLAMVERELRLGAGLNREEAERLAALLGREDDLRTLTHALAQGLRDGTIDLAHPGLLEHLELSARDALRINNPKWLEDEDQK
ncbi:MAG: DUF6285 domain-containing protein [Alphaproteobacteria bacterium]|jgi:hypothetical protein|nr:DUF6285 domain-containing protein [Alphaproteobacteria bacterium]